MDACHLTGDQRGCLNDIVQPLGNNEILLDTFSVDAQNECHDTWNFALTCDKKALCRSNVFSFCGDRLKGQDIVNSYVYPELDFTKCHFHIKENIKEKGGTDCDISFFQEIAYSLSDGMRKERIDKYLRSHRPRHIKDYFRQSILPHQDKWAVYLMKGNKEGLFTCQMCESFHNTIRQKNIRDSPMVFVPELIIQYEHTKIHKLLSKYEQQYVSHQILPSNLHNLIIAHTHNPSCYEIVPHQHAILCAKVTAKFNTMRFSHSINLSVNPPTCSLGCLRLLGVPCKEMCTFAASVHVNLESIMEKKFTVEGCYDLLKASLDRNHPKLIISNDDLKVGNTPLIRPPHIRTGRGRPKKKRMRKGDRMNQYVDMNKRFHVIDDVNPEDAELHPNPQYLCQLCGLEGHNSRTCSSSTDGQGQFMSQIAQDEHIKKGYLIIPIGFPGSTILPSSLEDFYNMRDSSEFPTMTFNQEIHNNPISLSFQDDDEDNVTELTQQSVAAEATVGGTTRNNDDICLSFQDDDEEILTQPTQKTVSVEDSVGATTGNSLHIQTQQSDVNSQDNSSQDNLNNSYWLDGDTDPDLSSCSDNSQNQQNDDNGTVFSYPSDVSHYTIRGHLTPTQLEERNERKKFKSNR